MNALEELKRLLVEDPDGLSLDDFRNEDIEYLLSRYQTRRVLYSLHAAQAALAELHRLEEVADMKVVQRLLLSGNIQIRGRDIQGRPVLWVRKVDGMRKLQKPYAEWLVVFFWVSTWGWRIRTDSSTSLFMIYDETESSTLDFNVTFSIQLGDLLSRLYLRSPPESLCWYFIKSNLAAFAANLPAKMIGADSTLLFKAHGDKEEALCLLADPTDYPDWFLPHGKPLFPSFDALGNLHELVTFRCGFSTMTLRDIHQPSPERIQDLRVQCAEPLQRLFEDLQKIGDKVGSNSSLRPKMLPLNDLGASRYQSAPTSGRKLASILETSLEDDQ